MDEFHELDPAERGAGKRGRVIAAYAGQQRDHEVAAAAVARAIPELDLVRRPDLLRVDLDVARGEGHSVPRSRRGLGTRDTHFARQPTALELAKPTALGGRVAVELQQRTSSAVTTVGTPEATFASSWKPLGNTMSVQGFSSTRPSGSCRKSRNRNTKPSSSAIFGRWTCQASGGNSVARSDSKRLEGASAIDGTPVASSPAAETRRGCRRLDRGYHDERIRGIRRATGEERGHEATED